MNFISEGRDSPALNRFLTRDRRDVKESEVVSLHGIRGKVSITEMLGVTPTKRLARRQFLGPHYYVRSSGPLVRIRFTQFTTFGQVARTTRIINQTDSEEFASVLEVGRVTNEVSQVPVDLDRTARS